MKITIAEFAQQRGLDNDTVSTFLRRHEELKGDIYKEGRFLAIDTTSNAYEVLNKQYPLPAPVQIIEDTESRQKLLKAQEVIIQLQGKLQEATSQLAQAEATKLLLEDKQEQLAKTEQRLAETEQRERNANEEIKGYSNRVEGLEIAIHDHITNEKHLEEQLERLQSELESEKAKSWWDKLRGR